MAPSRILDSHIHLWPSTSTGPENHGWMTPGFQLAKRHGISDYTAVSSNASKSTPFIYVETDRYLPSSSPDFKSATESSIEERKKVLQLWAKEPLEEIKFLRRMVENEPQQGDGFADGDGELLKGAVLWAPFHLPPEWFRLWLDLAEEAAGEKLWPRVVGFRFLLQGKAPGEVGSLTREKDWIENIVSLREGREGKCWTFDIGVDTHRDGVEMLDHMTNMVKLVRTAENESGVPGHVKFILNHFCKSKIPAAGEVSSDLERWTQALNTLASDKYIYMKLSGLFNEFDKSPSPNTTPSTVPHFLSRSGHLFDYILASAFKNRSMFGSDWPVCNVGGPASESGNWKLWVDIVEKALEKSGLDEQVKDRVWVGAAAEAYGVAI